MKVIPRHEPEVIERGIIETGGQVERVATTALTHMVMHGAILTSRFKRTEEYRVMVDMMERLGGRYGALVDNIYCDGNAVYQIVLHEWDEEDAGDVAKLAALAALAHGGHNRMILRPKRGDARMTVSPNWK